MPRGIGLIRPRILCLAAPRMPAPLAELGSCSESLNTVPGGDKLVVGVEGCAPLASGR